VVVLVAVVVRAVLELAERAARVVVRHVIVVVRVHLGGVMVLLFLGLLADGSLVRASGLHGRTPPRLLPIT